MVDLIEDKRENDEKLERKGGHVENARGRSSSPRKSRDYEFFYGEYTVSTTLNTGVT